ncbi:hypothetical protein NDU88_006160 [Pleurodeles waltl]|uniref:Uncharacterized protein n=1 Tax=Pleurodeles waltl TaxID=8319 RepID=A0AAV7TER0_PLEWA|nr:hypothetical protein NDU88_006160 [Pleurodeles waltl]
MLTKIPANYKREKLETECSPDVEHNEASVTRSFVEKLFVSVQDNLQVVERDLSLDLQEVPRDLDEVGERIANLECKEDGRCEEIKGIQQEILHLQK